MQGTAGTLPGSREVGASYAIPLWVYGTNNGVPGLSYARRTYIGRVHIDGLNTTLDNCFHDPVASPPLGYANTQTMEYAPHPNSYTYFAPVDKGVGSKKRRSVDLLRNSNYSLLISSGTWIGPNLTGLNMETNNIGAWIDFNGDGDFLDTYGTISEQLGLFYNMLQGDTSFNVLPSGVGYVTFPLNIPDTGIAPNGCPGCPKTKAAYVRLRISAKCSSGNPVLHPFNAVPTYFHGETEDYDVRLLADVCPDSSLHICKWIAGSATDPTNWHRIENWCPRIPTIVDEAWVQPNIAGNYPVIHTDSVAVCSSLKIFAPCTVTADAPDAYVGKSKASLTMAKDAMLGVTPNTNGRLIVNSSYQDTVRIPNVTQVNYTLQSATNTPFAGHRTDCRYQILLSASQLTSLYGLAPGDKIDSIIFPIKKNTAGVYSNFSIRYYLLNPASFNFVTTVTNGQEMLVNSAGTTNPLGLVPITNGPFNYFNSVSFSTTGTSTTWTDNVFPNQFGSLIWDGVKDIVLDISFNNAGGAYAAGNSAGIPDFVPLIYSGLARKCGYVSAFGGIGISPNGRLFSGTVSNTIALYEDNTAYNFGTYSTFAVTSDYQPAIKLMRSKRYSKFPIYVGGNWINNNQSAAPAGFVANLSTVTMQQHAAGFTSKLDSIQGTQVTRFNELVVDDTTGIRLAVSGVVAGSTALIIDTLLYMRRGMLDLNGYTVSIENPLVNALRDTNDIGIHRGFIRSENTLNRSKVLWKTGLTNVIASKKYKFPFGSVTGTRIPLTISVDSGRVGDISVSTYATNNLNTPLPTLPDAVNNQCYNGPTFDGTKAVDRFWQIDVSSPGTSRASIEFMYQPGELTNGLTTTLNAQRYNKNLTGSCTGPGMWITAAASGAPQTNTASVNCYACANAANSVQVQNVYNFSPWSLVALPNPLQVQLLRFDAKLMDNKNVKIDWATADESSLSKFEVLKSYNQKDFEVITQQRPFYKLQNDYTAWDYNTHSGTQFYKLKLINYDGTEKFSHFVPITIGDHVFEITSSFYNNEDGLIHLQFDYDNYEPVQIFVYNSIGELLYNQKYVAAQPGVNYVLLNAIDLNGMNYVILQNSKEQKVKKLMSVK
ncbi:MAG: hypothetical protein IPP29_21080 [Bacteroidetes bacterium]|nr:hypothetical protein [Bacteroidota bacterium]